MSDQERAKKIADEIVSKFGDSVLEIEDSFGDAVAIVDKAAVHDVLSDLRWKHGCDLLLDVIGIDCSDLESSRERFEVEYVLYAIASDTRFRVRTPVPETDLDVPTVTDLWQSANWGEREAYEMFGVNFVGHPCLKRLLTHHEFEGHPLRKDYPMMGGQWCTTTSVMTEELEEEQGGAPGGPNDG